MGTSALGVSFAPFCRWPVRVKLQLPCFLTDFAVMMECTGELRSAVASGRHGSAGSEGETGPTADPDGALHVTFTARS